MDGIPSGEHVGVGRAVWAGGTAGPAHPAQVSGAVPGAWGQWAWSLLGLALAAACYWREASHPSEGVSKRPDVHAGG